MIPGKRQYKQTHMRPVMILPFLFCLSVCLSLCLFLLAARAQTHSR